MQVLPLPVFGTLHYHSASLAEFQKAEQEWMRSLATVLVGLGNELLAQEAQDQAEPFVDDGTELL
eukprot:4849151-Alexandrium_andersonii.AAC.1